MASLLIEMMTAQNYAKIMQDVCKLHFFGQPRPKEVTVICNSIGGFASAKEK